MGADMASVMDPGRHLWLQMMPKSRTTRKEAPKENVNSEQTDAKTQVFPHKIK